MEEASDILSAVLMAISKMNEKNIGYKFISLLQQKEY